nr:hypothetical protein Iba_chr06cCG6580 [Ipomoea batatas]
MARSSGAVVVSSLTGGVSWGSVWVSLGVGVWEREDLAAAFLAACDRVEPARAFLWVGQGWLCSEVLTREMIPSKPYAFIREYEPVFRGDEICSPAAALPEDDAAEIMFSPQAIPPPPPGGGGFEVGEIWSILENMLQAGLFISSSRISFGGAKTVELAAVSDAAAAAAVSARSLSEQAKNAADGGGGGGMARSWNIIGSLM